MARVKPYSIVNSPIEVNNYGELLSDSDTTVDDYGDNSLSQLVYSDEADEDYIPDSQEFVPETPVAEEGEAAATAAEEKFLFDMKHICNDLKRSIDYHLESIKRRKIDPKGYETMLTRMDMLESIIDETCRNDRVKFLEDEERNNQ
jgi:hypothetical protein